MGEITDMAKPEVGDFIAVVLIFLAGLVAILALDWPGIVVGPIQLGLMWLWFKALKDWNAP